MGIVLDGLYFFKGDDMIEKIEQDDSKVEIFLDVYDILITVSSQEYLDEAIKLLKTEYAKGLGDVTLLLQVRNMICIPKRR